MSGPGSPVGRAIKTAVDRCAAAALLVGLSPLLLLLAILVRTTTPGPAIHRRRVLGQHGAMFEALKFRTMVVDADRILRDDADLRLRFETQMKLPDDPRVTRVGRLLRRTSFDELPQLLNVLRGEMSLVGPRMIAPEEAPRFGETLAPRLSVKPGMTGLWQVSGRHELDYDARVALDRFYVEHWSLWLDLVILLRTIPAVLRMTGR